MCITSRKCAVEYKSELLPELAQYFVYDTLAKSLSLVSVYAFWDNSVVLLSESLPSNEITPMMTAVTANIPSMPIPIIGRVSRKA